MSFNARELLQKLTTPESVSLGDPHVRPSDLPVEWWQLWDERAAIMEYDRNLPRERAEALALDDILKQMELAGVTFLSDHT